MPSYPPKTYICFEETEKRYIITHLPPPPNHNRNLMFFLKPPWTRAESNSEGTYLYKQYFCDKFPRSTSNDFGSRQCRFVFGAGLKFSKKYYTHVIGIRKYLYTITNAMCRYKAAFNEEQKGKLPLSGKCPRVANVMMFKRGSFLVLANSSKRYVIKNIYSF